MATIEHLGSTPAGVGKTEKVIAGSSLVELIAGAAAIVLPILGLLGVLPLSLAAIAFIAIGGGMMLQEGALISQSARLLAQTVGGARDGADLIGGMTAEMLGGTAAVALGILALLRVEPINLMAVAAVVAGGSLILGAGTTSRFKSFGYEDSIDANRREIVRASVNAAAGADILVGLSSVVLGILVLAGIGGLAIDMTLILVAALALGGALFLNGTAVGARMAALFPAH